MTLIQTLIVTVFGPLAVAFGGVMVARANRSMKSDIQEVKEAAQATEKKVTSNHGHDNIGDKVDKMYEQMRKQDAQMIAQGKQLEVQGRQVAQVLDILPKVIEAAVVTADRVEVLETAQTETANQVADQNVVNTVSFEELNHSLDDLNATAVASANNARKCRRRNCNGFNGDGSPCGFRH